MATTLADGTLTGSLLRSPAEEVPIDADAGPRRDTDGPDASATTRTDASTTPPTDAHGATTETDPQEGQR